MENLGIAFLMGFLGSVHCVGMCGGFALLSGVRSTGVGRPSIAVTMYLLGKTLTYAVMGAVLAGIVSAAPMSAASFQKVVALFTGLFLIAVGWHMTGRGPNWALVAPKPASRLVARMTVAVQKSSIRGRFLLGMINGLIPCGLVYAALGYSMTMPSAAQGALFMAVFGIGTSPALALVGLGSTMLSASKRAGIYKILGWLVVVLGLMTIIRATPLMHRLMQIF